MWKALKASVGEKAIYLVIPWLWRVVSSSGSTWEERNSFQTSKMQKCSQTHNLTPFFNIYDSLFPPISPNSTHHMVTVFFGLSVSTISRAAVLTLPWPRLNLYYEGALAWEMRQFCSHTSLSVNVDWENKWRGGMRWSGAINGNPAAQKKS